MKKEYYEQNLKSPIMMDTIEETKKIHEFDQLMVTSNVVEGNLHRGLENIR